MMSNIGLITSTFIVVNIDFFLILIILLNKYSVKSVWLGYYLGLVILISISFFVGQILKHFFPEWILGILGVLPIIMAFKEEDDDDVQVNHKSGLGYTLLTYLSVCAGCNLSIFLPVLANEKLTSYFGILIYIFILSIIIIVLINWISKKHFIVQLMQRYGEKITKICYIGVGLYVFYDSGLLEHLLRLII